MRLHDADGHGAVPGGTLGGLGTSEPARAGLPFLVDRHAFAEPPRNEIVGRSQRDHVRDFVPQRTRPVEAFFDASRRWAVHEYDIAERNAEYADARQTGRAHGEVLVTGVQFDDHRIVGYVPVPLPTVATASVTRRRT